MKLLIAVQDRLFEDEMVAALRRVVTVPAGSSATVIHVVPLAPMGYGVSPEYLTNYEPEHKRILDDTISALAEQMPNISFTGRLEQGEDPCQYILEAAHELEPDLIVLGTHCHGAIGKLFMGSVSTDVTAKAPCPILLVPKQKQKEKAKQPQRQAFSPV